MKYRKLLIDVSAGLRIGEVQTLLIDVSAGPRIGEVQKVVDRCLCRAEDW